MQSRETFLRRTPVVCAGALLSCAGILIVNREGGRRMAP